ncbi:MAG TPA: hypothetical protein VFW42_11370 [Fluviicoccus sp.]|nr:hypothetical protein [Fluviicoccus sp.]
MTAYLGFVPSESLQNDIRTLLGNLDRKVSDPQFHLANGIASKMTDEIIDNLLLNMVNNMGSGESSNMINFLGSFLKKTMHVMLKMMLGKAKNDEVAKRAVFIRARFLNLPNDTPRLGFPLPHDLYDEFQKHFAAVDEGQGREHIEGIVAAMMRFSDLSLVHYFDEFVATLDLGMILRKTTEMTRSALHKELHSVLPKMVRSLKNEELKHLADYLRGMLVER